MQMQGKSLGQNTLAPVTKINVAKIAVLAMLGLLVACSPAITKTSGNQGGSTDAGDISNTQSADSQMLKGYADIPIPQNDVLIVSESLLLNSGEQWLGRAVLESKLDANEAFEYFSENMAKQGWITIVMVQSNVSLLMFEKGNRIATIQIEQRLNRASSVKVTVAPRENVPVTN